MAIRCEHCGVPLASQSYSICPPCREEIDKQEDECVTDEKATLLVDAIEDFISARRDADDSPESVGEQRRLNEAREELKRLVKEIVL